MRLGLAVYWGALAQAAMDKIAMLITTKRIFMVSSSTA